MNSAGESRNEEFDAVVVGAGLGGLVTVHRLREAGYHVIGLEAGSGVGGTWYWNRYPGARCDIESVEYSYSFSEQIAQEWRWPERYSTQSSILAYLEHVADRLSLHECFRFDTKIHAARFLENDGQWSVSIEPSGRAPSGSEVHESQNPRESIRARFLILATGFLSKPILPNIPGIDEFPGGVYHTGSWPKESVDLTGKVGVVGTAASGVQVVQTLAGQAERLVIFQRTPNWCLPLRNEPMSPGYDQFVKDNYEKIRELERENRGPGMVLMGGDISLPEQRLGAELSEAERREDFQRRWDAGGVHMGRTFRDILTNREVNDSLRIFLAEKIAEIVKNPDDAANLVPDHPPLSRRPPGEAGYYDAFNREDVRLVDVRSNPIERFSRDGKAVLRDGEEVELDTVICATGFDGGSGAALGIDIHGRGDTSLKDHWRDGAITLLGLMTTEFPNLFFVNGAQSPGAHFNPPLLAEFQSEYVVALLDRMSRAGIKTIEPDPEAEVAWSDHVDEIYSRTLIVETDSWWVGSNVAGKPRRAQAYGGGFPEYRRRCFEAAYRLQGFLTKC